MDTPRYDTDAEPIVQLTDSPRFDEAGMPEATPDVQQSRASVFSNLDKTKLILPASILIAAILISGSILYTRSNTGGADGPVAGIKKPVGKVNIDLTNAMILGDTKTSVTIVEYGDYQCPFCERYFQQNESAFISQYVNTGKARFVWKDYAFLGQESIWAAQAARCANDQNKFWEYHNYLYSHQGAENSGAFSKANLKKFASALGLNMGQFNTCLDTDKYASFIQQENQAASAIGVNGTPATFINGLLVADSNGNSVGAAPFATFQAIIEQILKK